MVDVVIGVQGRWFDDVVSGVLYLLKPQVNFIGDQGNHHAFGDNRCFRNAETDVPVPGDPVDPASDLIQHHRKPQEAVVEGMGLLQTRGLAESDKGIEGFHDISRIALSSVSVKSLIWADTSR